MEIRHQKINSFKDLVVWQRAMELAEAVYNESKVFPREEQYGLQSQMRRAAVSIPSNIAEGSKRGSRKDYVQFLRIANGSAAELETQILLSEQVYKINFIKSKQCLDEVRKMLIVLMSRLSNL